MQDNHDFYGWEVQSHGVTLEWTDQKAEAEKAYNKCRIGAKLFKHNGQTKTVIAQKHSNFAKLKDVARLHVFTV